MNEHISRTIIKNILSINSNSNEEIIFNTTPNESKRLSITIPGDLVKPLSKLAQEKNSKESEIIVTALRFFVFVSSLITGGANIFVQKNSDIKKLTVE